ncbi:hypothetical protein ACFLWI_02340 [Chloroflexota bacterium]
MKNTSGGSFMRVNKSDTEIELWLAVKVTDNNGKVISRQRRRRSHSYVQGWNWVVCAQFLSQSNPSPPLGTVRNTAGGYVNLRTSGSPFRCNAGAGVTNIGIRVGTDNTPVAITDYALKVPIGEGTGSGQMEHQAQTFTWIGVAGNVCSFQTERVIVNNSGAQINVREAAIYMMAYRYPTTGTEICASRDLISQDVPNGGSITVTYTVRVVA